MFWSLRIPFFCPRLRATRKGCDIDSLHRLFRVFRSWRNWLLVNGGWLHKKLKEEVQEVNGG